MGIKVDIRTGSFEQLRQLIQEGGRIRSTKQGDEFVVYATQKRSSNRVNRLLDHCSGNTGAKRLHVLASVKALCARHGIDFDQEIRNCGMSIYDLNKVLAGKGDLKGEHLCRVLARFVEVDDKMFAIDLRKPLGRGANAEVFEARHGNERIAVRRVIPPTNLSPRTQEAWLKANDSLRREVATHSMATRNKLPGEERSFVLPTHDEVVVAGDGTPYQAMKCGLASGAEQIQEHRKADTLAQLFSRKKKGPLMPPEIQRLKENRPGLKQEFLDRQGSDAAVRLTVVDWAKGVDQAGLNGVAHRDIKPENFLIDDDGYFQLTDFGTSSPDNSLFQSSRGGATVMVTGNGNDFAKSPEWLEHEDRESNARFDVGPKSDSFSLGVAGWRLLTGGRFPFDGTKDQPDKAVNGTLYVDNVRSYAKSGLTFSAWYESRHPGLVIPQEWRPFLDASLNSDPEVRASPAELGALVPRFDQHKKVNEATVRQTMLDKARRGRT